MKKYIILILLILFIYLIYILYLYKKMESNEPYIIVYSEENIPIFVYNEPSKSFILEYNYEKISKKIFPINFPLLHKIHGLIIKYFYPEFLLEKLADEKKYQYQQFYPGFYLINCLKNLDCRFINTYSDVKIHSTINYFWTKKIHSIIQQELNYINKDDSIIGSVIVLEKEKNQNQNILRVITNNTQENYYDTFTKVRLAGSTLKPFLYALAFEKLSYNENTMIEDVPKKYYDEINHVLYMPKNHDNKYLGNITIKEALSNSRNIPAVEILYRLKKDTFYDFLYSLGIDHLKSKDHYNLSIALGTAGITQIQLSYLYSLFINDGILKPITIGKIDDNLLYLDISHHLTTKKIQERVVFSKETINKINSILVDNDLRRISFGRRNFMDFNFPIIAKTGTSYNYRDSWIVGIVDHYLICVWVGKLKEVPMIGVSGINGAGRIFYQIVKFLKQNKSIEEKTFQDYKKPFTKSDAFTNRDTCEIEFPKNNQKVFLEPSKESNLIIKLKCFELPFMLILFNKEKEIFKNYFYHSETYIKFRDLKKGQYTLILKHKNETKISTFQIIE